MRADAGTPGTPARRAKIARLGRAIDRSVAALLWLTLALVLIDIGLPGWVPPATLASNVRHLVLPVCVPLLMLSLVRSQRARAIGCAVGIAILGSTVAPWLRDPGGGDAASPSDLRLITANLGDRVSDGELAATCLASLDVDVIVLQEVGEHHRRLLAEALRPAFPHQRWHPRGRRGKAVLSRYPITADALIDVSPRVTLQRVRIVPEPGSAPAVELLNVQLPATAAGMGAWSAGRDPLLAFASQRSDDVRILAGDFNTSPWGGLLRELTDLGFANAFSVTGCGAGCTFPLAGRYRGVPLPPLLRLDHVLVDPGHRVTAAEVAPDLGSDHLPLLVQIRLLRSP